MDPKPTPSFHTSDTLQEHYGPMRKELAKLLRKRSLLLAPPGEPFTLKNGSKSDYYLDVRKTAMRADGACMIGQLLYHILTDYDADETCLVAGVALGACPLATACSMYSAMQAQHGTDERYEEMPDEVVIHALYVREAAKTHGGKGSIMGAFSSGQGVVVVEDVVTTGTSTLRAMHTLIEAGLQVRGVVAIVDREEGGTAALRSTGIPFLPLFTAAELRAS